MFFLLFKRTDNGVVDDFPMISDHFPKIFQSCPEGQTFLNIFREFPNFPKIAEDFRGKPEDVSMIHQRI